MATNTTINQTGLVNYIQSYYDKIIYSQLQANYGRVFIDMGLDANQVSTNIDAASTLPFSQALFEKRLKELRDKVSFDGFTQTVTNSSVIDHGTSITDDDATKSNTNTHLNFTTAVINPALNAQQPLTSTEAEEQELSLVPISLLPGLGAQSGGLSDAQKYKGKSLRLGRKVEFNDVVFAERPMSSLNIEPEYVQSCDYCLRPITSLEEQVWSLLIAGEKTAKSTNAKDIIALLHEIAPFHDVINEYIYLSSMGDDDEEEDYKDAIKNGKLTKDEYEMIKSKLNQHYLADNNRNALIDFYNKTVLRPYNYIMRELHQREKDLLRDVVSTTTATTTTTTTITNTTIATTSPHQQESVAIREAQQAMYDLLEETDEKTVLDINELDQLSIFEPSTRFAEVPTPVYTPYSANMYCSVRCMCIAYNNYEHILAHAYPRVGESRFEGFLDDDDEEEEEEGGADAVQLAIDDYKDDHDDDSDDHDGEAALRLPPNKQSKPSADKTFPLKPVPHSTIVSTTTNTNDIAAAEQTPEVAPGMLTTSLTTIPGPSGLPFLQQPTLYQDLVTFTRGANPMFLQHIRGITQSISYWGLKLVEIMGGDYNDVIALLTLQGEFLSVQNTAMAKDLVNYTDMIAVHNDYLTKYHNPEAVVSLDKSLGADNTGPAGADIVGAEAKIHVQLDNIAGLLEIEFGSAINTLRDRHAQFYSQRVAAIQSAATLPSDQDPSPAVGKDNDTLELFSTDPNKNLSMLKCFCTECLAEASFSLLQYSIFPYLLFTQTQWFTHVHDANGDNMFSFMDKNPAEKQLIKAIMSLTDHQNAQNSNSSTTTHQDSSPETIPTHHASLFRHQMDLLQALQDHFEPIIEGYTRVMSVYCSLITPLYKQCLKKAQSQANLASATSSTPEPSFTTPLQSPFFIDVLFPTISVDETKTIPIPYSTHNVKESMNDIPDRVANFANAIQRPIDCCNWLVLSQFVSICEMNNIQIAPKSGAMDLVEFITVDNLVDVDPEDVEEAEEKMDMMYQAAVNVHLKSVHQTDALNRSTVFTTKVSELSDEIKSTFPPYLIDQSAYIEHVLKLCGKLSKKRRAPVGSKKTTDDPSEANGDYIKAWTLLNKRVDVYPECSGLFRVACTMNHSCDPNCTVIPLGDGRSNLIAIVALRDISPGEELTISYIDDGVNSYTKRQSELKDYQFVCACKRCIKDKQKLTAAGPAKKKPLGSATKAVGGVTTTTTTATTTAASKPTVGQKSAGGSKTATKSAPGASKKK